MTRKKEDDNEKSPSPSPMEQSQYVKMRVRQNSDDSMGSEMTLSLPSLTSDNEDEEASDNNTVKVPLEPTENRKGNIRIIDYQYPDYHILDYQIQINKV